MADPFRSARLVYRAVESPDDDALFQRITTDPFIYENSNARLKKPQSRKDAAEYQKDVAENALIGVVMCIPPSDPQLKPISIGVIFLKPMTMFQHRFTELGIDILPEYQSKGYGTESIEWIVDWAFNVAGLHRVNIRAFEWNYGARKLYQRIGFKEEGIIREELFHNGRYWDGYHYGMLDREWKEIRASKENTKS